MDQASGEDWAQVAREALERHLERLERTASPPLHRSRTDGDGRSPGGTAEQTRLENAAYDQGYTWARDPR
jgi:hypothetical protein